MKFALLIRGVAAGQRSTALAFAEEALAQGHQILQIFFQSDGVHQANRLGAPPPAEFNAAGAWSEFAASRNIDLVLCGTAGLRRGVREANLAPGFRISGVGQWLEASLQADRIIIFGS